jgi:hypothetical protein
VTDRCEPGELVLDDPEWPMPQPHGRQPSIPRRLRVWRLPGGTHIAVVTERGPGMSITNVAEHAHAALTKQFPGPLKVVEHYPDDDYRGEHFDEITVTRRTPSWRPLATEQMVAWCGPSVLDDMPELPPDPEHEAGSEPRAGRLTPPDGPPPDDGTTVHGFPLAGGALVTLESATGDLLGPLPHYVKHSPNGYGWGGYGSGCAELARCILITALGNQARCPTCAGTGRLGVAEDKPEVPLDPTVHQVGQTVRCSHCEDGIRLAPALYQRFKEAVVATWPAGAEWRITVGDVRRWLAADGRPAGCEGGEHS